MDSAKTVQGTEEWHVARRGFASASRMADIMAKTKSGPATTRANYAAQIVAERLTGVCEPSYTSAAMQRGTELEPEARAAYSFAKDADVQEVGFLLHPSIEWSGASPDGLVGDDGLVEFKCPSTATHIETLESGKVDRRYMLQMQWQMACSGRAWCDFVSYDPRMPPSMSLFIKRIPRDPVLIAEMEAEVTQFLSEVQTTIDGLTAKYGVTQC